MAVLKSAKAEQRRKKREEFWPNEDAWTGEAEKGWFFAPRTLPLVLSLLKSKAISGKPDLNKVYLELWARHIDSGLIEMEHEDVHAYAAGYAGERGVHTWQERMKILEGNGLIRTKRIGNQQYRYVLLVHPTTAIKRLRDAGKVSDDWWATYRDRQLETRELTFEQREEKKAAQKRVVPIRAAKSAGGGINKKAKSK